MKKLLLVCLAVALVLSFGSIALADSTPGTGIKGTFHDLRSGQPGAASGDPNEQGAGGLNRICVYCHAPHNTNKPDTTHQTYMPLWNHDASARLAAGGWSMYSNGTDVTGLKNHQSQAMKLIGANRFPGSVSLLCLSCHDGTTATNAYGYAVTGSTSVGQKNKFMGVNGAPRAVIGGNGDLSNHHPIGFSYTQAQAQDVELHDSGYGWTNGVADYPKTSGPSQISDLLWGTNGNVECVSCHDVHNTQNGGSKFTWIEDRNSQLCLTCHNKDGNPAP